MDLSRHIIASYPQRYSRQIFRKSEACTVMLLIDVIVLSTDILNDPKYLRAVEVNCSVDIFLMSEVQRAGFYDHRGHRSRQPCSSGLGTTALQDTTSSRMASVLLCNVSCLHQTTEIHLILIVLQGHMLLLWLNTCFSKSLLEKS